MHIPLKQLEYSTKCIPICEARAKFSSHFKNVFVILQVHSNSFFSVGNCSCIASSRGFVDFYSICTTAIKVAIPEQLRSQKISLRQHEKTVNGKTIKNEMSLNSEPENEKPVWQ